MTNLLPLTLQWMPSRWRYFQRFRKHAAYSDLEKKVLERDQWICQYCGFESQQFQWIVQKNQDYKHLDFNPKNWITCCDFCGPCFFMDRADLPGFIIYLPELTQIDLNHFCRALFVSLHQNPPYKSKLQATYLSFKDRLQITESIFGPDTGIARQFSETLLATRIHGQKNTFTHPVFQFLRYLPTKHTYDPELTILKNTVFKHIPV
jgi:intracellular multiplication protein IcmJ